MTTVGAGQSDRGSSGRWVMTDPLLPMGILLIAIAISAVFGVWLLVWVLFGLIAGHSLSGST